MVCGFIQFVIDWLFRNAGSMKGGVPSCDEGKPLSHSKYGANGLVLCGGFPRASWPVRFTERTFVF